MIPFGVVGCCQWTATLELVTSLKITLSGRLGTKSEQIRSGESLALFCTHTHTLLQIGYKLRHSTPGVLQYIAQCYIYPENKFFFQYELFSCQRLPWKCLFLGEKLCRAKECELLFSVILWKKFWALCFFGTLDGFGLICRQGLSLSKSNYNN